jgi:hypothetical protein
VNDIDRRTESELRRGHPDEDRYTPPAWDAVRTHRVGSVGFRRTTSSALMAASITTVVLLIAALGVGIAGALRPDVRTTSTNQPPTPSLLAVASPSARSPESPTPTVPPSPPPSAGVDCGRIASDVCARVVEEVASLEAVPLASVSLRFYEPNCQRTGACSAAIASGESPAVRIVGQTTSGESVDWFCSQDPGAPNCAVTPEVDREPVSTLRIRLEGQKPRSISLREGSGGFSRSVSASRNVFVTIGTYELAATIQCPDCPTGQPPPLCTNRFDVPGGAQIDAAIGVTPGEGCTIEISITAATDSTCQVSVDPSPARVGETVRIEASGLTANGYGLGLADIRQDGRSVALDFGPDGTFVRTFTAGDWMVGDHEVRIADSVTGCLAKASLTIVR